VSLFHKVSLDMFWVCGLRIADFESRNGKVAGGGLMGSTDNYCLLC